MKRPHDLEDACGSARKHRKPGFVRIPLDQIGFWPGHRDGLGISSHHVHIIAWDCKDHGTQLQRYQHVDLIEIPQDSLQQVRDANRERCEADDCMPRFSPHMKYVCATKTHFVHAQKLAAEGNRSIFNKGDVNIRWQDGDLEGAQIIEQGPLCVIHGSSLLHDSDATIALASDYHSDCSGTTISFEECVSAAEVGVVPSQEMAPTEIDCISVSSGD